MSIFVCTAHKKRCRLKVAAYLEGFEADIRADIERESASLLRELEKEEEEEEEEGEGGEDEDDEEEEEDEEMEEVGGGDGGLG